MMDVSLVWADDIDEGSVASLVEEEIGQLQEEISALRKELFMDKAEGKTSQFALRLWPGDGNPLSTSTIMDSPSPSPSAVDPNGRGELGFADLAAYAARARVRPLPVPPTFDGTVESLGTGWRETGRLVSQERSRSIDNAEALEWLTLDGNRLALLSFVFHEFDFSSLDVELAFRFFLERLRYLPKEGQKQARLISAFGCRYYFDCPTVVQSAEAATNVASGLFMLHTMLHHVAVAKDFAFDLQGWLDHNKGLNGGNDFDPGMLADAFANVRDAEFVFQEGPQHGLEVVKHGWLEMEKAHRSGSFMRRPPKLYWGIVADGKLYLLQRPGKPAEAVLVIPLEIASLRRSEVELGGISNLTLEAQGESYVFWFRSEWAMRSWAKCLTRNVDRPFPGIRVHDVPAESQERKSSLKIVENPVFQRADVVPLLHPQPQSPVMAKNSLVHVSNPLYGKEEAEGLLSPKAVAARPKTTANPLFNNESLEALLSPRARTNSSDRVKRTANPLYANDEAEELLSSSKSATRIKRVENPVYRKHHSTPDFSSHLSAKREGSPQSGEAQTPLKRSPPPEANVNAKK